MMRAFFRSFDVHSCLHVPGTIDKNAPSWLVRSIKCLLLGLSHHAKNFLVARSGIKIPVFHATLTIRPTRAKRHRCGTSTFCIQSHHPYTGNNIPDHPQASAEAGRLRSSAFGIRYTFPRAWQFRHWYGYESRL